MVKRLVKKLALLAVLTVLFLSVSNASGERDPWKCPGCGKEDNTDNFCENCGYPAPETEITIDSDHFPDDLFREYVNGFDSNKDGKLSAEEIARVTSVTVNNSWDATEGFIYSLKGIEYFTNLTSLNCEYNQLTSLDISRNGELTYLDCLYNKLEYLDVSHNTLLTVLNCLGNQLTSLDVSSNPELMSLDCSENQLSFLDVTNNTALSTLACRSNQLTSLDVSRNTLLSDLACNGNQLTSLDVSQNIGLTTLACGYNRLTLLDISKNTVLTELSCHYNQINSLDLSSNSLLQHLMCGNNKIETIDIRNCQELNQYVCKNSPANYTYWEQEYYGWSSGLFNYWDSPYLFTDPEVKVITRDQTE